jgi:thymidylate synthase (FAD)
LPRINVSDADEILDKEFPVLNHGFVRLVDYMGGDERIVAAARVSYGHGTKTVREDVVLINYLMRNEHTSPFEQVVLTFHCKMPIFVARQWIRHRTARVNEVSGRYSKLSNEFYLPDSDELRKQSARNKQGRSEEALPVDVRNAVLGIFKRDSEAAYESYERLLEFDLARELARINLPLSSYTEWYWQIDLRNLFHFLKLRLSPHAQHEIRKYAEVMSVMARKVAPMAYGAFEENVLHAKRIPASVFVRLKDFLASAPGDPDKARELVALLDE